MAHTRNLASGAALLAILVLLAAGAQAPALAGSAAKRPAARKAAPKRPPVRGTTQFSGDQARLGQTYTLGKEWPMNIAVNSLRYSVERLAIGERVYVPKADEKLLIIEYKFHNPVKREQLVRSDSVRFFAVDAKDQNRNYAGIVGDLKTREPVGISLKPGQATFLFTYIVVPADLGIPKLVIQSRDNLVLRYDVRGKIKGLQAPFADPKDTTGAAALATVPAQLNTPLQIGCATEYTWDVSVEQVAFVEGALGTVAKPEKDKRLLVMTAQVTNCNPRPSLLRGDTLNPVVITEDGEQIGRGYAMLAASGDRTIGPTLDKAGSVRMRQYFQVPKDAKLKTLLLRLNPEGRAYAFDISNVQ